MKRLYIWLVIVASATFVSAAPAPYADLSATTNAAFPFLFNDYQIEPVLASGAMINPYFKISPAGMWKNSQVSEKQTGMNPIGRNIFQNFANAVGQTVQEIINRQQQLLSIVYCPQCENTGPWQTFLNAVSTFPNLSWIAQPTTELGQTTVRPENERPTGTFIAATNVNGVVTGVGGSIFNDEPVVQYTYSNNHISPTKPLMPQLDKPNKPALPKPMKSAVSEQPTEEPYEDEAKKDVPAQLEVV